MIIPGLLLEPGCSITKAAADKCYHVIFLVTADIIPCSPPQQSLHLSCGLHAAPSGREPSTFQNLLCYKSPGRFCYMWILTKKVWGGIRNSAYLTSSQLILMLLVWDPTLRSRVFSRFSWQLSSLSSLGSPKEIPLAALSKITHSPLVPLIHMTQIVP